MGSLTDNTGPTSVPAKACQEEISKQRLNAKAQESAVHFFGQTHERRRGSGQRFIPLIHLSSSMKAGPAAAFTVVNPYVTGMTIVDNPEDQLDTSNAAEVVQGRSHGHFISRMSEEEQLAAAGLQWPPRSYSCTFCRREFCTAQALGGHMNVHRRQRALLRAAASDQQYSNSLSPASCTTSPTPSPAPINIFFNKGLNVSNPETNSSLTHPAAVLIGAGCSCSVHPGAAKTNSGLSMQEINETLSNSFAVPSTSLGLAPYCPVISDHQRSCDNNGRPQLKRVKLQNNISTADSDHNKLFVCNEGVINNSKHLPSLDLELRLGEPIIHSWHSSTTTTTTLIK